VGLVAPNSILTVAPSGYAIPSHQLQTVYLQVVKIYDHIHRKGCVRKMTWQKLVNNDDFFVFNFLLTCFSNGVHAISQCYLQCQQYSAIAVKKINKEMKRTPISGVDIT
jgi:hypothetical protein